eukprot:PhF_6_TR9693/c0_g1_i2/m.14915
MKVHLWWLSLLAGALCGLASGCLWTAQGWYLAAFSSANNAGHNTGLFFMLFQMSQVLGNVLTIVVLSSLGSGHGDADLHTTLGARRLFEVFGIVASLGSFSLYCILPDTPSASTTGEAQTNNPLEHHIEGVSETGTHHNPPSPTEALSLLRHDVELRRFAPLLFWSGMSISVYFSFLPSKVIAPAIGLPGVGSVMAFVGLGDTIMSMVFGILCDSHRPNIVLACVAVCVTFAVVGMYHISVTTTHTMFTLYLIGFVFGTADAACTTYMYFHTCTALREHSHFVFAWIQSVQGLVGGVGMLLVPYVEVEEVVVASVVVSLVGVIPLLPQHYKNKSSGSSVGMMTPHRTSAGMKR